jgi:hypothetical protein
MLIDWLQKPSTIIWGLYLAAAELASCLPSYSFSCILVSDENHAKDYSGNQPCATMHEAVFRFSKFIWVNATHDNISGFAAVAVAVFTFTLWRSTLKLWETGEKQIAVAKVSADAAIESNKLTSELFQSEQRAWISAAATLASGLTWEESGARLYIDVILDNVGKSPALDVSFEADTFMSGRENPEPEAGLSQFCEKIVQRRSSPRAKGVTVFPGKPTHVMYSLLVRRTDIDRNIVIKPDWFSPMIQGCVVYKTTGAPDMKYTGILYNILARHETDPFCAKLLRISNGDLQIDQFGIGPYAGGDIAT